MKCFCGSRIYSIWKNIHNYTLNPVYLEVRVTKKIISILKQLIALLVHSDWLLKLGIAIVSR